MYRLIHLSDPHLSPLPAVRVRELMSKRILGYINWRRNRARAIAGDLAGRLVAAVADRRPDHIAVTGDLVNLALRAEIGPARRFLELLGEGEAVTVVPGNHDAYVPGAARRVEAGWGSWMTGDGDMRPADWPILRRRGPLALVGLSTAQATGPFMATGRIGTRQAARLDRLLEELADEDVCPVLLIHHPPFAGAATWHKRLVDAERLREIVARRNVAAVLHGHTHLPTRASIPGRGADDVPVIGVPAALQRPGGHRPASGFNEIAVDRRRHAWHVEVALRQLDGDSGLYAERERLVFDRPLG